MLRYILVRLSFSVITVIGVLLFTFMVVRTLPGDPALLMAGFDAGPEELAMIRTRMGLDQALPLQFIRYMEDVLRGDLGFSLQTGRAVINDLHMAVEKTLSLVLLSVLLTAVIGIAGGILAMAYHNTMLDYALVTFVTLGLSIPPFFLALVLVFVFAVKLNWLPAIGSSEPRHLVLPVLTLMFYSLAQTLRMTRATLLDLRKANFVMTAHAKGLRPAIILWRHLLPNCVGPIVTVIGLQVSSMLGGAAIVEMIFSYPGVGSLLVKAISARDFPIIQGAVIFVAIAIVLSNLVTDVVQAVYNPQLRDRLSGSVS